MTRYRCRLSNGAPALLLLLAASLTRAALGQPAKPDLQTLKVGEWYTVTCPKVFQVGTEADVTVAYHGIAEKTKLLCDLHYQKTDGSYGGFYSNDWRGSPDIQGDGQHTFTIPIREKEGIASATILLFTDPAGQWATHTREATSTPIPVNDPDPGYSAWTKQMKWNKSWIAFDWSTLQGKLTEGDKIGVTIEYYLDPSEHYQKTTLALAALGPRVPKPNAPKPVSFDNTEHLWYGEQTVEVKPGRGKHTFELTVPKALWQNWLLLLGSFSESRGKRWPWDVRAEAPYVRKGGFFELETGKPANLFTYAEPVRISVRLKSAAQIGQAKALRYTVYDATRAQVAAGTVPFTVTGEGQIVPIDLRLDRRGAFLLRAEVDGWEARETTFCRIPDVLAITGGKPTSFGMTVHSAPWLGVGTEEVLQTARRLGLTTCRAFTEWSFLEPGPDVYTFPYWDHFFDSAKQSGIDTIITIYNPPAWVQPEGQYIGYQMFQCDLKAFQDMVRTVSTRYKGKIWGWEWLNEITPGGTPDYVGDYVRLCKAGTETARAVDPSLRFVLAGGLWPRGYRLDVLNAGAGKYIDALPIHYGNGTGVEEARADLDAFGHARAAVWDNETAAEVINWETPGLDIVSDTVQPNWVLGQWADELSAGCQKLIYFGGEGSCIGDFDYLFGDHSPRPVAATVAVFASKLFDAKPVGMFTSVGKSAVIHVFERQGKAILVASSSEQGGETVPLAVGAGPVRITDYQGNESQLPARNGIATLPLRPLRCFVEGADLDVVKAYLAPAVQVPSTSARREQIGVSPQVTVLRGQPASIPVRLWNPYQGPLAGTVSLDLPAVWLRQPEMRFSLNPGETKTLSVPVLVPEGTETIAFPHKLTVRYAWSKLPVVAKPFTVSVISRDSVGNLLANGDFEETEPDGVTPRGWSGTNAKLVPAEGLGLGLGKHVLKFENAPTWAHYGQQLNLRGGMTYLYTAWVWNHGMEGGSNINQVMQDGSERDLYDNSVINIGTSTPYWQVFTCRYQAPPGLKSTSFIPVVQGTGWAMYDNIRVTAFEGSDFAAEAWEASKPPAIGGGLDNWNLKCPIPLIGRNQLRILDPKYQWSPENLNGVAYLAWDAKNLYVYVQVLDDVHFPAGDGETVTQGDSLILAFDPTNRGPDAASRAVEYLLSSQKPAGGSGKCTLWRSRAHSGGRPAGHLARDSSVYDVAITPSQGGCVYQVRIPFSELGITPSFGAKLGFSIQLNDNDGAGLVAQMNWGGGLSPAWSPANFGIVTLM